MLNRTRFGLLSLATVTLFSVLAIGAGDPPPIQIGSPAPAFSLTDENGKAHELAEAKGQFVVLEWTNPSCPFVQDHYKKRTMQNLYAKYHDKGVSWFAINSGSNATAKDNAAWAQENKLAYPVLDDHAGKVGRSFAAKTTPDMFIIDKTGKVIYEGAIDNDPDGDKGANHINYIEKALDEALAGKPVSIPQTKSYGCHVGYAD